MALELAGLCSALNCMPKPGGLLDQDSYHVHLIRAVHQAQAEVEEEKARRARGARHS